MDQGEGARLTIRDQPPAGQGPMVRFEEEYLGKSSVPALGNGSLTTTPDEMALLALCGTEFSDAYSLKWRFLAQNGPV